MFAIHCGLLLTCEQGVLQSSLQQSASRLKLAEQRTRCINTGCTHHPYVFLSTQSDSGVQKGKKKTVVQNVITIVQAKEGDRPSGVAQIQSAELVGGMKTL